MSDHFFVQLHRRNRFGAGGEELLIFQDPKDVEAMLYQWLSFVCGRDCYRGPQDDNLRDAAGRLPEEVFVCPKVETPDDLNQYKFLFEDDSSVYLNALYDKKTTHVYVRGFIKEYSLEKVWNEENDHMLDVLDVLERSFEEDVDYKAAVEEINHYIATAI